MLYEHPKEDKEEWITAAGALALLKDTMPSGAAFAICARANDGMIKARAERFMRGKQIFDDVEVPTEFWWAEGHPALQQNWKTGDFETWINHILHLKAYGVSFLRSDIEKMIAYVPIEEAALAGANATGDSTTVETNSPPQPKEMLTLKPTFMGMSLDLKELFRRVKAWWKRVPDVRRADSLARPGNDVAAPLKWDGHLGHTYYSSEDCTIFTQAVQISASNVSDHEIRLEDAYIVSGETGDKIIMKVGAAGAGWIFPSETNPIPPGGTVTVRAEFNAPIGLAASDFFNKWKVTHLTTKYDGAVHRKLIDEKMVSALFAAFRPNPIGPRMTKRQDAQ